MTNTLLDHKKTLEIRISEGEPAPPHPTDLPWKDIEVLPQLFQHREDAQRASDEHVKTLVKGMKNSTKSATKKPLEPLTIFWTGSTWALIDGHHRLQAYKDIKHLEPVPVNVFDGSLDEAIGQALKGNSKDKLPMAKSEKTNAAWRLVISTGLSLSELVEASTISKPTIITMRKALRHLTAADPSVDVGSLTWQQALRKSQGKDDLDFEPDHEWRDKRVAQVAETLSKTFGGEFKRKPEMFWDAVRQYDAHLTDYFLTMHGVDPEDFKQYQNESTDF